MREKKEVVVEFPSALNRISILFPPLPKRQNPVEVIPKANSTKTFDEDVVEA